MWRVYGVSSIISVPNFRVFWWFSSNKTVMLPNHRRIMKTERVVVTVTSEKLHILTLLSVRENLIEFCSRKSIKSYTNARYWAVNSSGRFLQTVQHIKQYGTSNSTAHQTVRHIKQYGTSNSAAHQTVRHIKQYGTSNSAAHQTVRHIKQYGT